jgi:hypothetical protein
VRVELSAWCKTQNSKVPQFVEISCLLRSLRSYYAFPFNRQK